MCAYYPWSSEYTKKKKNTIGKLILMRMLNIKQDKVGHKRLLLAKFGPEDVNKHRLQNILVMLRTAATENAKGGLSEALTTIFVRC